ncbi:MAG: glycosyltransferase [Leptospiraceae bacterium]|nr:glycosyltransferase [Leptospiraceae bacterium]
MSSNRQEPLFNRNKPVLSVLIPVYNEMETIGNVLNQLLQLNSVKEVIVVDDCSTDQTPAILSRYRSSRVIVHRLPHNSGKTAAKRPQFRARFGKQRRTGDHPGRGPGV